MTTVILTVLSFITEYVCAQEGEMNALRTHVKVVKYTYHCVTLIIDQSLLKLVKLRLKQLFLYSAWRLTAKEVLVR